MIKTEGTDNIHLNPSKRKILFNSFKKTAQTTIQGYSSDDKNGSLLRMQSLSLLQDTGSQQATNLAEDNRQMRQHLDKLKKINRQLMSRLTQKESDISRTEGQYKTLLQRFRSQLQKANVQRKASLHDSPDASSTYLSFKLTPPRDIRSSRVSSCYNSRSKAQCQQKSQSRKKAKILQLWESLQGINFKQVEKLAYKNY